MKILATADTHIGFRQYGLLSREHDIEEAFLNLLKLGSELKVNAITVSGDIIHTVRPTAQSIHFLKQCQDYLIGEKILCLVSIGNHDKSAPHWLDTITGGGEYGFKILDDDSHALDASTVVYGKTFCSREEFETGNVVPKTTDVLLMHQSFNEITNFSSEKSFSFEDFENVPGKLVIIGDTHIHRKFDFNDLQICSPGSTELMSEAEESDKYAYLCTKEGDEWSVESVGLKTRDVQRVEIQREEDLQAAIKSIKDNVNNGPIVFLKFNTDIEDVLTRVRTQVDADKIVLRPKPVRGEFEDEKIAEAEKDLTFSDILKDFIPDNPQQFEAVSQLLQPDAEVHGVLDSFIEQRLSHFGDD